MTTKKLTKFILALGLVLGASASLTATATAQSFCYDFESDATGDYSSPMNRFTGFIDATFSFENDLSSNDLEVVDSWGATGNHSLAPYGDPVVTRITARVGTATLPTVFKMALGAWNGDVDIEAYDSDNFLIWSDTFAADADHAVEIDGEGEIAYLMVYGGDREVFIDDVCIEE